MSEAKSSKSGRNKAYCASYKLSNSAKFNKAKRIVSHLNAGNGDDKSALQALANLRKADGEFANAFNGVEGKVIPSYLKRMAYNHKRYAKALRQHAKAIDNGDDGARMKAAYHVERFHR